MPRCGWATSAPEYVRYHDEEWGTPLHGDDALFERVCLEAFQSGLAWITILRKRPAFRAAFADFDPDVVATFTDADVERLMQDAGIVRNRMKITATIQNARATVALRHEGGLVELVWSFRPADTPRPTDHSEVPTVSEESKALSKALRKKGFAFVGPTTMYALMEAVGIVDTHLVTSHRRGTSGVWPD
jgi:DNA-3-methyladenine glycosylase I